MTREEEIVKIWDEKHPNQQTEIQTSYGKIASGARNENINKWAVIRAADNVPFEPYYEQLCYVFDFPYSGRFTIGFHRRKNAPCNKTELERVLEKFENKKINGREIVLTKTQHGTLMLRVKFGENSSAESICDCMEKFIELTQKSICEFLGKTK